MRHRSIGKQHSSLSDTPSTILTFAVCSACWILCYAFSTGFPPEADATAATPLWAYTVRLLNHPLTAYAVGILTMLFVGYVLQRISDREMFIRKYTRLPIRLFLMLVSADAGLMPVKEVSFVWIGLVFVLYELFDSFRSSDATDKFFNAGALTGFAGLFMPQAIWFMPLIWIGMYRFRSLTYRSFIASVLGLGIVYWIVAAGCLWYRDFSMLTALSSGLVDFKILSAEGFHDFRIRMIIIVFMLAASFIHIRKDASGNSIRVQQILFFLINMSIWSCVLLLLFGGDSGLFRAVIYLPASALMAYFLENIRRISGLILFYFMLSVWFALFILRIWTS